MTSTTTDRRFGPIDSTAIKIPCDLATTANITLSGEQSIDGTTTSGSRVLVCNQTDATTNGIYDTSAEAWTRSVDCNGEGDLTKGALIFVTGGSTNGNQWFYCSTASPIPDGSMSINFGKASTALAVVTAYMQTVLATSSASAARTALGFPLAPTIQKFTASGTYTPPSGLASALVMVKGNGAAGGGSSTTGGGGGGGEGLTAWKLLTAAQIGASQTVTIGAASTSVAINTNANGSSGITASFGALLMAGGGNGGSAGNNGGSGGQGGTFHSTDADWVEYGAPGQTGADISGSATRIYACGGGRGGGIHGSPGQANSGAGGGGGSTAEASGGGGTGLCVVLEYY